MSAPESPCHFLFRHPSALSFVYSRISFLYNLYFQHDCLPFVGYADSLYSFSSNKSHHNRLLPHLIRKVTLFSNLCGKQCLHLFHMQRRDILTAACQFPKQPLQEISLQHTGKICKPTARIRISCGCSASGTYWIRCALLPRLPHPDKHILLPYSLPSAPYAELLQN